MKQVVIYGGGNTGKSAYYFLKNHKDYECLFFVDSDENKCGECVFEGMSIKPPYVLKTLKNVRILIASIHWREIYEEIKELDLEISVYKSSIEDICMINGKENDIVHYDSTFSCVLQELNQRTIDLGAFLRYEKEILCKELTFLPGGSTLLDYAFLKVIAEKYHCKYYMEIGTYIGESINILTDFCEKLYSITAPEGNEYSMDSYCKKRNMPNYSEKLAYRENIVHFYEDSKQFDFSKIKDPIELYFIDGDHSYNGVYADTKNIFETKMKNAIVVWHDFRKSTFQYNVDVIQAVKDVLQDEFKNVFVTNGNLCGVYFPDMFINDFDLKELKYEKHAVLNTYDILLRNFQVR